MQREVPSDQKVRDQIWEVSARVILVGDQGSDFLSSDSILSSSSFNFIETSNERFSLGFRQHIFITAS